MEEFRQSFLLSPVTAFAFSSPGFSPSLALVGEGSTLKVFDQQKNRLIAQQYHTLKTEAIHGIRCSSDVALDSELGAGVTLLRCLVWGRRAFAVVLLNFDHGTGSYKLTHLTRVTELDDWILDGTFSPVVSWTDGFEQPFVQAVFVSAHNDLIAVQLSRVFSSDTILSVRSHILSSGPATALYCAQCFWHHDGQINIAAGSMFGEILVWKYCYETIQELKHKRQIGSLSQSLIGHEGSVFGVDILCCPGNEDLPERFILCSCSDDRTIRVWDITQSFDKSHAFSQSVQQSDNTGFGNADIMPNRACLASAVGHYSRIWSVRAIATFEGTLYVFSFGEDATTQVWKLSGFDSEKQATEIYNLEPIKSVASHSGKNIWASEVKQQSNGDVVVITGGADGRVVSCIPVKNTHRKTWTCPFDRLDIERIHPGTSKASAKAIFNAMRGEWNLSRDIVSVNSTYPSGRFEGVATLSKRPTSDVNYDQELLYSERGNFSTTNGLNFEGSRRYVYRYQENQNRITAWFVKLGDEAEVDYLFHQVSFGNMYTDGEQTYPFMASGHHLCVKDDYNAKYEFPIVEGGLATWELQYVVKGPSKDYTASATYTRDPKSALPLVESTKEPLGNPSTSKISLKLYRWLTSNEVLASTDSQYLLRGTRASESGNQKSAKETNMCWEIVVVSDDLQSHSPISRLSNDLVLIGGKSGALCLFRRGSQELQTLIHLPERIAGIFPFDEVRADGYAGAALVTCLGTQVAAVIFLSKSSTEQAHPVSATYNLELPQGPNVTSVAYFADHHLLLLGLRPGKLCVYDLSGYQESSTLLKPTAIFEKVHLKDAITSIKLLPPMDDRGALYILTTGRDGLVRIQKMSKSPKLALTLVHSTSTPIGSWLEGSSIDPVSHDILSWGFRGKDFSLWNVSKDREALSVDCGGGHRSLAFLPTADGKNGGSLVWTKAGACHVCIQEECETKVIQQGSHGREIKCMASTLIGNMRVVATGSEDTRVRLSVYQDGGESAHSEDLQTLSILTKHTTGVQQVRWAPQSATSANSSSENHLLFTAGGREEFFAWQVTQVPCVGLGVVCVARCPPVTEISSDLRIMDFAVLTSFPETLIGMIYSDSTIRVWKYNPTPPESEFTLVAAATYSTNCLTQILPIQLFERTYLVTTATDGKFTLWTLEDFLSGKSNEETLIEPVLAQRVHQNSIKTLAVSYLSPSSVAIASGGDDNGLGITLVTAAEADAEPVLRSLLIPKAHAASITAVEWILEGREDCLDLLSASNDQMLKRWQVVVGGQDDQNEPARLEVHKTAKWKSEVADVACIEVFPASKSWDCRILLAGIGFETWNF